MGLNHRPTDYESEFSGRPRASAKAKRSYRVDFIGLVVRGCSSMPAVIRDNSGNRLATTDSMTSINIHAALRGLKPAVFTTLRKINPTGSLQARQQKSGATSFYWRYSVGPKSERVLVGLYDSGAPPKSLAPTGNGFSYAAAVRRAETMALEHHQHLDNGGRPALIEAQRRAKKTAADAERSAAKHTLTNLLADYCDYLEAIGRRSYVDARSIFNLHVRESWPSVASLPAKDVTDEQVADMMRRLIEAGKGRTANKLRSYARAAFQVAKAAKSKPSIPVAFKDYGITVNPVADTMSDETQNRSAKNPLPIEEMRRYWVALKAREDFRGALLRFHLLTGAQRIEQLVNLRTGNIKNDRFTIFDGKGRPGQPPRPHTVPLIPSARRDLDLCTPTGIYALSTDGGETHLSATTLSGWAKEIAEAAGIEGFVTKRLRSGVETLLASAKVSKDSRGHLQSHGIAGVQARHYDDHDYMDEKVDALETLFRLLEASGTGNGGRAKVGTRNSQPSGRTEKLPPT